MYKLTYSEYKVIFQSLPNFLNEELKRKIAVNMYERKIEELNQD